MCCNHRAASYWVCKYWIVQLTTKMPLDCYHSIALSIFRSIVDNRYITL